MMSLKILPTVANLGGGVWIKIQLSFPAYTPIKCSYLQGWKGLWSVVSDPNPPPPIRKVGLLETALLWHVTI